MLVSFSKNGEWLGDAFKIPRIAGMRESVFPHVVLKNAETALLFTGSRMNNYKPWQVCPSRLAFSHTLATAAANTWLFLCL